MSQPSIGIICTSASFGGLEINTLKLALLLKEKGWRVCLLLNKKGMMYQQAINESVDADLLQDYGGGDQRASATVIHKWNKERKCSLLFVTYNKDISAIAAYKRFYNRHVKLVYQQHMQVGVKKRDLIHTLRYKKLDLWISPLEYLKEETIAKTRVPANKITVIPLAIDETHFSASTLKKEEARQQLTLPEDGFLIGVLGRVDPKKGQDFLIRALAYLKDKYPDLRLLIMGNVTANEGDDFLNQLHELVKKHQLEDRVFFRGYIKDPVVFYKAIDVFAMPSHGETYGMVTLEAMASGVPVIGVGKDGTKEILKGGKLGWLHELEDIHAFSRHLAHILENEADRNRITDAARAEVMQHYTADKMMRGITRVLEKLLQDTSRR